MRIEIVTLIIWLMFFAVGFFVGCFHGEKKALNESQDQRQRDLVADVWLETISEIGGKNEQDSSEKLSSSN